VTEYIEYNGQKSPDVSCPEYDPKLKDLVSDAKAIAAQLKLKF
jgi:hypothetical protein